MAFLKQIGVQQVSLGFEPLEELGDITGMLGPLVCATRKCHRLVFDTLSLGGKRKYHDRFYPDQLREEQLYSIYPKSPILRQSIAMAHYANISFQSVLKKRYLSGLRMRKAVITKSAGEVKDLTFGGI